MSHHGGVGLLRRLVKRALGCLRLITFIFFAVAMLVDTAWLIGRWSLALRIGSALIVAGMVQGYTNRTFKRSVINSSQISEFDQLADHLAGQLQTEVSQANFVNLEQAEVFARAIVETTALHQRIVEDYQPNKRTLRRQVTIDIQIPRRTLCRAMGISGTDAAHGEAASGGDVTGAGGGRTAELVMLYPIVVPPKSVFYDDLRVRGAGGETLATLSYREYLHVAGSVVRLLLASACNAPPEELPEEAMERERRALWGIIRRIDGRSSASGVTDDSGHASAIATAVEVAEAGRELARSLLNLNLKSIFDDSAAHETAARMATRRRAIRMAAELVEVLSTHYAIVAVVPVPVTGRFAIRYECMTIPELNLTPDLDRDGSTSWLRRGTRALRTRLHILLSTRPIDVKLSLDNAWTCQSYHVMVHCPSELYLAKQQLDVEEGYLQRVARRAPAPPHIRFRRRLGQSYAHLYARFLPPPHGPKRDNHGNIIGPAEKAPKLLLHFQEVPPGSVCRAALAAIASTVLVWIIGYGLSHNRGLVLGTEAPVLLLAFPGVAASWLGFDGDAHLFEGTLTARLSLACTALVSLIATGLYLLHRQVAGALPDAAQHPASGAPFGVLGITDWPWAALTVFGVFNASYMTYRWGINSWRFKHLADRPDPAAIVAKVRQERHEDRVPRHDEHDFLVPTPGLDPETQSGFRAIELDGGSALLYDRYRLVIAEC